MMTSTNVACASESFGAKIDQNISEMTGDIAVPRSNGEMVFDAPWQSRAFGLAVSLCKEGYFKWDTFRAELARAIREQGQNGLTEYYLRWLDALEASMAHTKLLEQDLLHAREVEFRDHIRDEVF